jgi:uncharacterized protein YkwD
MVAAMRWPTCIAAALLTGTALAREATPVSALPAAQVQQQVLELVNKARARGRTCGREQYGPAAALAISDPLYRAARSHARDMARRNYFEHQGRDGKSPKDRVQREGYRLRLTGENIAFGPETAAEVVAGWLASPGHCANIMDPRFRDMGVAVSQGRQRGHFYWVQELGQPAP